MNIDPNFFARIEAINWFSECGKGSQANLEVLFVRDPRAAIESALGPNWEDAGTAAQSELTGCLARTDYDLYGTTWNSLAATIQKRIQNDVMPKVGKALNRINADELCDRVCLDLVRIALYAAYAKRIRQLPDFFEKLLVIYERGHLPCGWDGDVDRFPDGRLVAH